MHVVYVPIDQKWQPVAWFDDEDRAAEYAEYLKTTEEFSLVKFEGEIYISGQYYEDN